MDTRSRTYMHIQHQFLLRLVWFEATHNLYQTRVLCWWGKAVCKYVLLVTLFSKTKTRLVTMHIQTYTSIHTHPCKTISIHAHILRLYTLILIQEVQTFIQKTNRKWACISTYEYVYTHTRTFGISFRRDGFVQSCILMYIHK